MRLTVGMAVFDDYDGAYFSVQALKMYHPEILDRLEIIIVDNKPDARGSTNLKDLLEAKTKCSAKYIPMVEPQGTTQPRNRIFEEATGDIVLCMDSHVLVAPGALARLLDYCEQHPNGNLLSGPILYDDLEDTATHFDDSFRSEMWGIWGRAWSCNHYHPGTLESSKDFIFSVHQGQNGEANYFKTEMGFTQVQSCSICGRTLPQIPYAAHQQQLIKSGYIDMANQPDPFPIPGMGLGLFACRRDAWLRFSPHFRGFGGEEMYIHEKYRKAGHQCICLPWLKWGHRFGRPNGIPYVHILTRWNKIRNYVLGANEVGYSLDRIAEHFRGRYIHPAEWQQLLQNPIAYEKGPPVPILPPKNMPPPSNLPQPGAQLNTIAELLTWTKGEKRDLDQHLDKLAELAGQCQHATEITHRRESTVALLAARKVVSYNSEYDQLLPRLVDTFPNRLDLKMLPNIQHKILTIEPTDMLFLDTEGTYDRLLNDLTIYHEKVSRYIAIHDTHLFRDKGEDGGRGVLEALRKFMRTHPHWSVVYHTSRQHGLTVLGCQPQDKPSLPGKMEMAVNLSKAVAEHTLDGLKNVSKEEYERRLTICNPCPQRNENSCSVCGCGLSVKAKWASSECPLGYWKNAPVGIPEPVNA